MPLYCPAQISRPFLLLSVHPGQLFVIIQLIILRVFEHTIGMDAGSVSKAVGADARLVDGNGDVEGIAGKLGDFPGFRQVDMSAS